MKFLKNRGVAAVISAVIVVLSTLGNAHSDITELVYDVTSEYYGGHYDEDAGYYRPALYDQLQERTNAATGILSVCASYPELDDAAQAFRAASDALYNSYTLHNEYYNNKQLDIAYNSLITEAENVSFSERDTQLLSEYRGNFEGAGRMIEQAGADYNNSVREFNSYISETFPANILSGITGVEMPELFE